MDRLGWGRHLVGTELFKPELETFKLETYRYCVHHCDQMTLFSGVGDILTPVCKND